MQRKIHMQDQVCNKVEDIMNHYKRNPIGEFNAAIQAVYETVIGDLSLPGLRATPFKMAHDANADASSIVSDFLKAAD